MADNDIKILDDTIAPTSEIVMKEEEETSETPNLEDDHNNCVDGFCPIDRTQQSESSESSGSQCSKCEKPSTIINFDISILNDKQKVIFNDTMSSLRMYFSGEGSPNTLIWGQTLFLKTMLMDIAVAKAVMNGVPEHCFDYFRHQLKMQVGFSNVFTIQQ